MDAQAIINPCRNSPNCFLVVSHDCCIDLIKLSLDLVDQVSSRSSFDVLNKAKEVYILSLFFITIDYFQLAFALIRR